MCSSYHGPSRSPAGRPAAASVAATNDPYIVSLSSSAGGGTSEASRMPATVLLPAPGGPATTQAGAGMLMTSEDMALDGWVRNIPRLPHPGKLGENVAKGNAIVNSVTFTPSGTPRGYSLTRPR